MPRNLLEHLNHELRSPMTVVVGMADLLLLAPMEPEQKNCVESVRLASDGLLLMLEELVDFSRLEAGSFRLFAADFSLDEVMVQARAHLGRAAGTKASFTLAAGDGVPLRMTGDATRLGQMIAGLVRSAGKLRAAKPLVLRASAEDAGGNRLRLHFALGTADADFRPGDASPGEPGQWCDAEYFRREGYLGAGLSLPNTAALAALMGGRLWMATDAAHPVIFRLSCLVERPSDEAQPDLLAAIEQRLDQPTSGSWNVLLAEDTRANQQFFRTILQQRGHSVVAVSNGEEAVEAFAANAASRSFDVVLLDLEMPVMDGRQAATNLRQSAEFAANPAALVALTAHRADDCSQAAVARGFDAIITKPCDLENFFKIIETAVRRARSACGGAPAIAASELAVDYRSALARLGGSEQLLCDLAKFFLEDAPGILTELSSAITMGDMPTVERAAHSLKGLAANFGAPAAVQTAAELQDAARRRDADQLPSLCDRLDREIEKLAVELRELDRSFVDGIQA